MSVDKEPKPGLIYLPWEIEFNSVYLKRGFSSFEVHAPFLDLLIKLRYPITINWLREWLGYGMHPDDRIEPSSSRGNKYCYELHEPKEGDEIIPDGIASVFWNRLVNGSVNKSEGGGMDVGGIALDELKGKYPELSARAEQEANK